MSAEITPGTIIANDFEIVRPLRSGGMGDVYVARQRSTDRLRALKVMSVRLLDDPVAKQRFEREARVVSRIESEHVAEVVAAGVDERTGDIFLAMDLLEGEALSDILRRTPRLSPHCVRAIMESICHALAAAHRVGVVHRDIKPENLFAAKSRMAGAPTVIKVLDFGIAMVASGTLAGRMTGDSMLGSPVWMAPEQFADSSLVQPATDVWALGLLVFAMLSGKRFWVSLDQKHSSPTSIMNEALTLPMPTALERAAAFGLAQYLPPAVAQWCDRCLQRDPRLRFANAEEAWRALAPLLPTAADPLAELDGRQSVVPASPMASSQTLTVSQPFQIATQQMMPPLASMAPPQPSKQGRSPAVYIAIGALVPLLMIAGGYITLRARAEEPEEEREQSTVPDRRDPMAGFTRTELPNGTVVYSLGGPPRSTTGPTTPTRAINDPPALSEGMTEAQIHQQIGDRAWGVNTAIAYTSAIILTHRAELEQCRASPRGATGEFISWWRGDGTFDHAVAQYDLHPAQACLVRVIRDLRGARTNSDLYVVTMQLTTLPRPR